MTETVLWENPNPTSAFNAQTVTLSDDVTNYDYIKIYDTKNDSNPNNLNATIYPTDSISQNDLRGLISYWDTSRYDLVYNRVFYKNESDNTKIIFNNCNYVNGVKNSGLIPIQIVGLK